MELLGEHMGHWSCSIAFPELAHLPLLHLRKFGKQCKVERFRTSSRALADALERNMAWVTQRRVQVDFSPKDTAQVNSFLQEESAANQVGQSLALMRGGGGVCVMLFRRNRTSVMLLAIRLSITTRNGVERAFFPLIFQPTATYSPSPFFSGLQLGEEDGGGGRKRWET